MERRFSALLGIGAALTLIGSPASGYAADVFGFYLDGAHALSPTTSQGSAFGTITYTAPDTLTLNITYSSLSSPLTQIAVFFGFSQLFHEGQWNGGITEFYAGSLPSSGSDTFTYTGSFIDQDEINSLNANLTFLSISTLNYPTEDFGEIGGVVMVPEPPSCCLMALGGTWLMITFHRKGLRRRTEKLKGLTLA
jgi:hypothetical protein